MVGRFRSVKRKISILMMGKIIVKGKLDLGRDKGISFRNNIMRGVRSCTRRCSLLRGFNRKIYLINIIQKKSKIEMLDKNIKHPVIGTSNSPTLYYQLKLIK